MSERPDSAAEGSRIGEEEGVPTGAPSEDAGSQEQRSDSSPNLQPPLPLSENEPAEGSAPAAPEPAPEPELEPDWHDLALRKAAELENVRKQTAQRVQKATRDGMRRVAVELLPALDDFERALGHAEAEEADSEHHLTHGIRLVQQQMLNALQRAGIESYSPKGETFDPHMHEAVATAPVEGAESGTVVEVYQAGYRLGDDVLRAAKVVVAA